MKGWKIWLLQSKGTVCPGSCPACSPISMLCPFLNSRCFECFLLLPCLCSHPAVFKGQTGCTPVILSHKDLGTDPDTWVLISAHPGHQAEAPGFSCHPMCTYMWSLAEVSCLLSCLRQESLKWCSKLLIAWVEPRWKLESGDKWLS